LEGEGETEVVDVTEAAVAGIGDESREAEGLTVGEVAGEVELAVAEDERAGVEDDRGEVRRGAAKGVRGRGTDIVGERVALSVPSSSVEILAEEMEGEREGVERERLRESSKWMLTGGGGGRGDDGRMLMSVSGERSDYREGLRLRVGRE
jgi:hypothetical protein